MRGDGRWSNPKNIDSPVAGKGLTGFIIRKAVLYLCNFIRRVSVYISRIKVPVNY